MDPKYNEGRKICTYLSEVYPDLFTPANLAVAFTSESYANCWKLYLKEYKVVDHFMELDNYVEKYQSGGYFLEVADFLKVDFKNIDNTIKEQEALQIIMHESLTLKTDDKISLLILKKQF